MLDELIRANLVTEHRPGRLSLHDLLRVYAAEQAHEDAPETERLSALRHIMAHYSAQLASAAYYLDPNQPGTKQTSGTYHDAMTWCATESEVLLAVIELATGRLWIGRVPVLCCRCGWSGVGSGFSPVWRAVHPVGAHRDEARTELERAAQLCGNERERTVLERKFAGLG